MKDFRTYIAEATKVNEYKLRLALNELTDSANVGKIKQYLEQYGLHGFKNPTKTIIQKSPMGLKTENAEVFIVEFSTDVPLSLQKARQDLCHALNVNENFLIVNDKNHVLEQEEEEAQAGETYETKLSTSSEYSKKEIDAVNGSEYYGNEFVDTFLKEMEADRKEREKAEVPA